LLKVGNVSITGGSIGQRVNIIGLRKVSKGCASLRLGTYGGAGGRPRGANAGLIGYTFDVELSAIVAVEHLGALNMCQLDGPKQLAGTSADIP
jgi:hypothetical protein